MLTGILTAVKVIAAIGAAALAGYAAWRGYSRTSNGSGNLAGKQMLLYDDPYYDDNYGMSERRSSHRSTSNGDPVIDDYVRRLKAYKAKQKQDEEEMLRRAAAEQQKKIQQAQSLNVDIAHLQELINTIMQQRGYQFQQQTVPAPVPAPVAPVIPTPTVPMMMNQPQTAAFRTNTLAGSDLAWDETERAAIAQYLNPQNRQQFVPVATPTIPSMSMPMNNNNAINPNNIMMVHIAGNSGPFTPRQPQHPLQSLYGLPLNQPTPNPWNGGYNPSLVTGVLNSHYAYHPMMRRNQFFNSPDNGYWQDMRQMITTDQPLFKPLTTSVMPAKKEPVIDVQFEPVTCVKGKGSEPIVEHIGNY